MDKSSVVISSRVTESNAALSARVEASNVALSARIEASNVALSARLDRLDVSNAALSDRIDVSIAALLDLKSNFTKYEPVWTKAGDVFEIVVRQSMGKERGESFSRSFEVINLNGLARLALPKDVLMHTSRTHLTRCFILGMKARSSLPDFRALVATNTTKENEGKFKSARFYLQEYDSLLVEDLQLDYLIEKPLGLQVFSMLLFKGKYNLTLLFYLHAPFFNFL